MLTNIIALLLAIALLFFSIVLFVLFLVPTLITFAILFLVFFIFSLL